MFSFGTRVKETDQEETLGRIQQHSDDVPVLMHDRTEVQRRARAEMERRETQRQASTVGIPSAENRHLRKAALVC